MIDERYIKPIPKYILKLIQRADAADILNRNGYTRYYAYLTKMHGELAQVTVACKNRGHKWFCKQVTVHGIHSDECLAKNINYFYIGGYVTGWYDEGLTRYRKWWETGKWERYDDKFFNNAPVLNPEYALRFPEYKYSAIDGFGRWDILKYLRLYEKYPQAEMLVKFGILDLALSVQILRKVGTDKRFRKWLANNRAELSVKTYYAETVLQAYKTGKPMSEMQKYLERKKSFVCDKDYRPIRELFKGKDLERFFDYIDKQHTNYRSYLDYLRACMYLNIDLSEDKNLLPHDFKRWHDIRIDEYNTARAEANAKERAQFYERFSIVAAKYLPLQNCSDTGFAVFIAKSPKELIHEGDYLHHCVGRMGYDQKFVREETLIFFIRNIAAPDVPFVTLEYSIKNKKILQCYGDNDTKPSESVLEFVNHKWLPFANRKIKKLTAAA